MEGGCSSFNTKIGEVICHDLALLLRSHISTQEVGPCPKILAGVLASKNISAIVS